MRAIRAKQLRQFAKNVQVENKTSETSYVQKVSKVIPMKGGEPIKKYTTMLSSKCERSLYQNMKKYYRQFGFVI